MYAYGAMLRFVNQNSNHLSLDNTLLEEDGNQTTFADLIESEEKVEQDIINRDFYQKNMAQSTTIQRFIKQRHYEEGMTSKEIVKLYSELTNVKDIRKINKILKI
jgi:hypothetical protein